VKLILLLNPVISVTIIACLLTALTYTTFQIGLIFLKLHCYSKVFDSPPESPCSQYLKPAAISKKRHWISIARRGLTLCRETIGVYCENHTEHLCGQTAEHAVHIVTTVYQRVKCLLCCKNTHLRHQRWREIQTHLCGAFSRRLRRRWDPSPTPPRG
jgi:hypothetical protein